MGMDFSFLGNVELDHVLQAMHDGRVRRALARALFDAKVRREYRALRAQGKLVREAVEDVEEDLVMEKKGIGSLAEQFIEKNKRGLLGAGGEGHVDETAPPAVVEKEEVWDALARDETGEADSERDAEATAISKSEPEADDRSAGEEVMSTIKGFTGHMEPLM